MIVFDNIRESRLSHTIMIHEKVFKSQNEIMCKLNSQVKKASEKIYVQTSADGMLKNKEVL